MGTTRTPWVLWVGAAVVATWTIIAIGVEHIAPYPPNQNFLFYLDEDGNALGEDAFRTALKAKVDRERQPVIDSILKQLGVDALENLNSMQKFQLDMQLRARNLTFDESADLRNYGRPFGRPGAHDIDGNLHVLGTDGIGRDVLSRLLYASRNVLLYASIATIVAYLLGITMGLCGGYLAGWLDDALSFLANVILSFPVVVLYIFVVKLMTAGATTLRPSAVTILFAVIVAATPAIFRVVRGLAMDVKTRDYIAAAETRGGERGVDHVLGNPAERARASHRGLLPSHRIHHDSARIPRLYRPWARAPTPGLGADDRACPRLHLAVSIHDSRALPRADEPRPWPQSARRRPSRTLTAGLNPGGRIDERKRDRANREG